MHLVNFYDNISTVVTIEHVCPFSAGALQYGVGWKEKNEKSSIKDMRKFINQMEEKNERNINEAVT